MEYLCRNCGNKVNVDSCTGTVFCTGCQETILIPKDTIAPWTLEARMAQLKAMHELMCNANDEELYMSWICVMPDGATEEDFRDVAVDDELYNECFDLFIDLVKYKGNRW